MQSIATVLGLIVLATVVAVSARRLRVPAPSLLVVAGVLAGLLPWVPRIELDPRLVALVVLPPLLYAAGEDLSWRDLRRVWGPVTILVSGLVLASSAAVAAVAAAVTGLPAPMAFVLGAILASTDPVAVTALGRRLPLPPRVHTLLSGESLFNDATSLVLFRVAVIGAAAGGALSGARAAGLFLLLAVGGAAVGAVVAACVAAIRRRTEDPMLETVIALLTPYVAYVAAEAAHVSGVTAVVVAAIILGGLAGSLTNPGIRLHLHAVYGTVVFLLESVVFSVIGLTLPGFVADVATDPWHLFGEVAAITATLLAVRFLWIVPLAELLPLGGPERPARSVRLRTAVVVSWAGARGVLPLTAALSLPLLTDAGVPLPGRELTITLTAAVVVLTLTVQGFTLGPLVRRSGIAATRADVRAEESLADVQTARAALARLEELEVVPPEAADTLRRALQHRVDEHPEPHLESLPLRGVRRELIAAELRELNRLHEAGEISDATRRRLQRALDRRAEALADP